MAALTVNRVTFLFSAFKWADNCIGFRSARIHTQYLVQSVTLTKTTSARLLCYNFSPQRCLNVWSSLQENRTQKPFRPVTECVKWLLWALGALTRLTKYIERDIYVFFFPHCTCKWLEVGKDIMISCTIPFIRHHIQMCQEVRRLDKTLSAVLQEHNTALIRDLRDLCLFLVANNKL